MIRRFVKWLAEALAELIGLRVVTPAQLEPVRYGPTEVEVAAMVETAVQKQLAEHTTAIFTAFKAAGVDVDAMVDRFSAFQVEVDNTVAKREAAVVEAEAALVLAEENAERAWNAQAKLNNAAAAMPTPGSIPAIEI